MLSRNNEQCAPESFVQTLKTYPVDVRAVTGGSCDVYVPNGVTGNCDFNRKEIRGVEVVNVTELPDGGSAPFYPIGAAPPVFDTRVNGTTSPENMSWMFYTEGARTLRYRATYSATTCLIPPAWTQETLSVNALNCLPKWLKEGTNPVIIHLRPQTVYVYIDPALWPNQRQGINDAINLMNAALDPYRGTYTLPTFQPIATGPCGGPFCVNMRPGTPPDPNACAGGTPLYDPSTGEILSWTAYWPNTSGSQNWGVPFNTRTALHELVHGMGLDDNSTWCPAGTTGSVMRPVSCGATSGYPTAPTLSDILPGVRSVYGGHPKTTCPKTN